MANDILSQKLASDEEARRLFLRENLIFEITERICETMQQQGISRSELASRIGKTRGYITQLLSGDTNMTLATISDVLFAMDRSLSVSLVLADSVLFGSDRPAREYELKVSSPQNAQIEVSLDENSRPICGGVCDGVAA